MACRAYDHTMSRVNEGIEPKVFWCSRCGTIKAEGRVPELIEPKLAACALTLCEATLHVLAEANLLGPDEDTIAMVKRAEAAVRECCLRKCAET